MSFNLTRKTDYALVALARLARVYSRDRCALSARQLAEEHQLPQNLLMNALKELHRAGILGSRRGVSGGYFLKQAPSDIPLLAIIEALEGPVSVTLCSDDREDGTASSEPVCKFLELCPISSPIRQFNTLLNDFLAKITIADIMGDQLFSEVSSMEVTV